MFRAVFDVNVLVAAVIRRSGLPALLLDEIRSGRFELVVSEQLLTELREVLVRPRIARFVSQVEADDLVAELERNGVMIDDPPPGERFVPRDPDDDYLVALARAGGAQVIVTGDAHLLEANLDPPALSPRDFNERLEQMPS